MVTVRIFSVLAAKGRVSSRCGKKSAEHEGPYIKIEQRLKRSLPLSRYSLRLCRPCHRWVSLELVTTARSDLLATSSAFLPTECGVSWSAWRLFGLLRLLRRPTPRRPRYCSKAARSLCGSGY